MSENMLEWPDDWADGRVVGQFVRSGAGTTRNHGEPSLTAAEGKVFITSSVEVSRYVGEDGPPVDLPRRTLGLLDAAGYLCTPNERGQPGERGIALPASNSDYVQPKDFTYEIRVSIKDKDVQIYHIKILPGETVDLGVVTPVKAIGGIETIASESTAARAEQAAVSAERSAREASEVAVDVTDSYEETLAAAAAAKGSQDAAASSASDARSSATAAKTEADRAEAAADSMPEEQADRAEQAADRAETAATSVPGIEVDNEYPKHVIIDGVTVFYDSGWRDISGLLNDWWEVRPGVNQHQIHIKRENNVVYLVGRVAYVKTATDHQKSRSVHMFSNIPGFTPSWLFTVLGNVAEYHASTVSTPRAQGFAYLAGVPVVIFPEMSGNWRNNEGVGFGLSWATDDNIPLTLPGTPA